MLKKDDRLATFKVDGRVGVSYPFLSLSYALHFQDETFDSFGI